jgi:truncated hemoglobin YjbI
MRDTSLMERPSMFECPSAFLALAKAFHRRCLEDPVLSHPFSHPGNPHHVERLADYWAEVFGGPPQYSESFGGHSAMLRIHAGQEADEDLAEALVESSRAFESKIRSPTRPTTLVAAGRRAATGPSGHARPGGPSVLLLPRLAAKPHSEVRAFAARGWPRRLEGYGRLIPNS